MDFVAVVDQVIALLRQRGRVAYRTLQVQFRLDDAALAALKDELLYAHHVAREEDERILVWMGEALPPSPPPPAPPEAERRQLTVLFCDLADSTRLARQLDPEDYRAVVRAYQDACATVIQRFDGYIAQYLGDGLLIYFGYPQAHEDDAQRAVRTGLGLLAALDTLNTRLGRDHGVRLAVRVGIHTGVVVVGEMGSRGRQEHLALGDTPNLAARLQGLAAPNTVVISAATARLVQGYFTCHALGAQPLKGFETPVPVSQVLGESAAQSRLEAAAATGLTPLVGRAAELTLLRERWAQVTEGVGQVVLLSGEAGIGKSRLVRVLTEQVGAAQTPWLTLRCSPYHTTSALYPVVAHLHRLLHWHREATPDARLATLEQAVQTAGLPLAEVVPLVAALLALPVPERYPPRTGSPQRQKQQTLEALVAWLLAAAAQQPVLAIWEDVHWADPSTLELLGLLLEQIPTARLLLVLTYRPDFRPPWPSRASVTPLPLTRLRRPQVEEMVLRMTGGKPFPAEVRRQIVAKTDGIPLFVEELVKTILEAALVRQEGERYVLTGPLPPLAIPTTLQDALMARLDRLTPVKAVAQLGAVLGREFSYALLRAVAPGEEAPWQHGLAQLVEAELLYQRGIPPQATYRFKHALVQDAAYHSLLRSTRQQYHQQIAQVLAERFPETAETQPELIAHHYTEAGLQSPAIDFWHRAGRRAIERSAHVEAVSHLTKGLELLGTLPDTPVRTQRELTLHIALGTALTALQGFAAPEVESTYAQARALCQRLGDPPQLFPVLMGLWRFYCGRGSYQTTRELAEQLLVLAQRQRDPARLLGAHNALGGTLLFLGDLAAARIHLAHGIALYDPPKHRAHAFRSGQDLGVACLAFTSWVLWLLGYPAQALTTSHEALALARALEHPFSLAFAQSFTAGLHLFRGDWPAAQEQAEVLWHLATEQGFPLWRASGMIFRGRARTEQGPGEAGILEIHQGLAAWRATGAGQLQAWFLALLAEAYRQGGQGEAARTVLTEALTLVTSTGERFYEAELYRLQGELLMQAGAKPQVRAAETCFRQALRRARRQAAKAWELRAAVSLSRLWQQQGKRAEASALLAPIYHWFTEGFDTADLQEAKALLDELA